jgi:hypothetical protein
MWLLTPEAFVSIVKIHNTQQLAIRCRSHEQLTEFLVSYCSSDPTLWKDIVTTPESDYRYRVLVDKSLLRKIIWNAADSIDYTNFKDACRGSKAYKQLLTMIWNAGAKMFGCYDIPGKVQE